MNIRFVLFLSSGFLFQNLFASDGIDVESINRAIQKKGAHWTAAENWVTRLSKEERRRLCGAIPETPDPVTTKVLCLPKPSVLPEAFDWRNNNGNWVTPVKQQGGCGSCWDFSTVAQVESWWQIINGTPDPTLDLSEQFILSCSNAGSCGGGSVSQALEFVKNTGVPPESCFPYAGDDLPCQSPYLLCEDWQNQVVTIPGWGYVTLDEAIVDNIKSAVFVHPLSVGYVVYDDFDAYASGVYEHVVVEGEEGDNHAVLIVGWNDADSCWIVKNSWGENWGENGYFRIKWGECGIGRNAPFIWNQVSGESAIRVNPDRIDLTLTQGDSIHEVIQVSNAGIEEVTVAAIDYELDYDVPEYFHVNAFNACDQQSWWCGDPSIGGYDNHWLQYLYTPQLDLSQTQNPVLTFMSCWSVEGTAGATAPWDGWDGCNVWISTDGGINYEVIEPTAPPYTASSLWSFGHEAEGWNFGTGIPGWAGNSSGWLSAAFDLSSYRTDEVIVRWAFASDLATCSVDNPALSGFFIDGIEISDSGNILFEDDADIDSDLTPVGYGTRPAGWLSVTEGVHQLQSYQTHLFEVDVNTENLEPGAYSGYVRVNSSDTLVASIVVPVNLNVISNTSVDFDLTFDKVPNDFVLRQNIPNPFNSSTLIHFGLPKTSFLQIVIYNNIGRYVKTLFSGLMDKGYHHMLWDGTDSRGNEMGSGLYIVRMSEPRSVLTRKILLVR